MKHVNKILAGLITCCVILLLSGCSPRQGEKHDFSIGKGTFLLDGKPFVIKAAEIHYTRIPAEYWQHRIQMCKALGMNTICIYAFWNIHEQKPGEFDFKGQNDIVNERRSAYAGYPRKKACISCCVPALMSALSGRWADCPGGC